jgi:hypothetical protein
MLVIEIENHGTADQIHDDLEIFIGNYRFSLADEGAKYPKEFVN